MDSPISWDDTSKNIFAALVITEAVDDLHDAFAKDFDDTFTRLEKEIPEEVARVIVSGEDSDSRKSLGECIFFVQEVAEGILKQRLQNNRPKLENIEKKLHASLSKAQISLESLRLIEKYLQDFCHKYPPQRIPDWENPTDYEYHGSDYDDYEIWKHDLGGQEGVSREEVGKNERMTLLRSIRAIQYYISYLDTLIPPGRCLHPEKTQKYITAESARINSTQRNLDKLRDMLDWGNNHAPYHALCAHGEPLGPNLFSESCMDVVETIKTWERICTRLNLNKKKKN